MDLIILLFYQTNKREEFKSFFEKINYKVDAVEYMIMHPKIFKDYNCSELKLIYDSANKEEIGSISLLSSDLNEFINFICSNIEKIKDENLYKYIDFENCPNPNEGYNFQNLMKFVEFFIDNKDIYFPSKQFITLVENLNLKDYERLIQLKSLFIEYKTNFKAQEILKKLNESIHLTGKKFIEENKLDNLKIISFIQEDAINYYDSYKRDENFARLIEHIDLDKIDNTFINKFIGKQNYDYKKLLKNNYILFINSIIKNVKSFQHLKILYKMFNLDENPDREIILEIINFLNRRVINNNASMEELSNILGKLFVYVQLIDEKKEIIYKLIRGIKFSFKYNDVNEIFINILNNNNDFKLNKDVIDILIRSINNNSDTLTNEGIITILNNFSNTDIQIHFLQKQRERNITEEELYKIKMSDNLKFVFDLIKYGFFDEKFNKVKLIKNIRDFMQNQLNNLKEFNFSIHQLIIMKELNNEKNENNLKNRLNIISLGNKSIVDDLYLSLIEKINLCYTILEQIKEIINIFSYYYPREEEETINKLQKTEKEINENPINKFPEKSNIIPQFDNKFNKADEINKLKDSKIFIEIFNKNKSNEKNDSLILRETKKVFNDLKKLFNQKTEDNVDLKLLEDIIKKIDMNEITKEFKLLMKIHEINKNNNEDIFIKLKLLKNKFKNLEIIHNIILLLNDFNLKNQEIKMQLEKIEEQLKQNPSLKKLMEIDIILKGLDLEILKSNNNQKYVAIINKMYEKPELINFIKDKTISDIHQMGEFIDDSEDVYITILDITILESCKKFLEELNKFSDSEKQFLNNFIKICNKRKYEDIAIKFDNSHSKYNDFHELYTHHLNPNELNKQHIKSIYEKSIFNIKQSYPLYECNVNFIINKKSYIYDFDTILDLRDVALLRKKDQREESYFEICEKFTNIVNEIQEILDILNIISSKGYYEKLSFNFEVINGDCFLIDDNNKSYDLKNEISRLKEIRNEQELIVREIYTYNPITRLIYGKQFEFIYNYLMSNMSEEYKINNILKYVTNNSNIKDDKNIQRSKEVKLKGMFENANIYLKNLYKINSIDSKNIYKKSFLIDKKKKGIYSYSCSSEEIEKNVIKCSLNLTGNFPIAQTVLYCNNTTSEEEITSFIYRSIKCELNVLFILIKPEILDIEKKNLLIQLLKDLYSEEQLQMNSFLLFVYSKENKTKEVIIEIEKLPEHKYFNYENKNNRYENKKFPEVEIYSSQNSGLGKSTLIKNKFLKSYSNYEYIYFPIGGDINRNDIINRLLLLSNKNIALHLDLNEPNNIELIKEFLFTFLILKFFSQKENIFFYGEEIKIKIEIPNSFMNFLNVFPILNYFKIINIYQNEMPELIVSENITSNIQIVCNYLKYINELNQKDIFFKGMSYNKYPNCIVASALSQKECSKLIFENINIKNPNFYQINSFINLISEQLKLFSNSIYLNTTILKEIKQIKKNIDNIRYFFVKSLTLITKHFITSSYDNILKGQEITYYQQKGRIDLEKAREESAQILVKKIPFSIRSIKPSMIFINEDGQSISEIITCEENCDEYKILKAIYNSDLNDESRGVLEYSKLTSKDFLFEVKKVLDLVNPIDDNDNSAPKTRKGKKLRTLENIVESYVFTGDNFIKLILISLRLRTNIPIIMMGETGCGKTSLIRIIAELKDIKMYIFNIHAGIEDKDIKNFLKSNNLFERNNEENNGTVWVFLDEINTCNSLTLITEIMMKNSCEGKKIRQNVKFIAACNPYRLYLRENEKETIGLYDESKHSKRKLVYNVNPLPIPLLNFVFDFGNPNQEDIKRYISNMLEQILKKIIKDNRIKEDIQRIAEKAIFDSQDFIKNNFEISSVSLREVRRWGILFEWFYDLLKNPFFKKFGYSNDKISLYSLNLSIYLCYYIRIFDKTIRKGFCELMKESFGKKFDFEDFPKIIQNIIADSVDLEKGIAKNRALLENLFSIFVCLNTKIPLFIIGKPGSSKSLSAQLIFKSMNGKDSFNDFFQHFPKVYTKSYQGSLTSNSKGVLKIFQKARKSLEDKKLQNEIISSIYFDEMGLAEISKNNPLKVIHSQLEYDENKEKVSFIGISNWPLDASKMNRGIYLSITEPDEEDLIFTALKIAESYDVKLVQEYKNYFTNLASTYFEYKELLKSKSFEFEEQNNKNIREFHGSRDFYHLIKTASKLLIQSEFSKDKYEIENIMNESIERNFGGLENSIKKFKEIFRKYVPNINDINEYNVMNCLKDNIRDSTSRYLLIITKSSISHFLVTLILDELKKNHIFYYGSNFEDDNIKGYYSAKVLNKIQITMSKDNVMILKNLTSMYPSLYDLFNQNFKKIGSSNYARIALGDSNTQNYFVDDNFRCIVILDKNEIDEQDPPFINRFEKHIITFEYLLEENQVKISKQINQIFTSLIEKNNKELKIDLKSQLLNCDLEEIQGIFYQIFELFKKKKNIDDNFEEEEIKLEDIEIEENEIITSTTKKNDNIINFASSNLNIYKEKILKKIIPTFSQDLIYYSKNSNFAQKYKEEFQIITDIYFKDQYEHQNLNSYLEKIDFNKHIIYTFSNILDSIFKLNYSVKNKKFKYFDKNKTKNIFVEQINSEREADEKILDFYTNNNYNLCIFHYDIDDCIHLNHINYLIEGNENNLKDTINVDSKVILFIIHLKRKKNYNNANGDEYLLHNEYLISHLTKWKQFFIDNLSGKEIKNKEVFDSSNIDLFNNKSLIDIGEEFAKDLYHSFTHISYNIKINFSNFENDEYIQKVCDSTNNDIKLIKLIQKLIKNKIEKIKDNITMKIFTEYNFEDNDVDFISVLIKYMKSIYNQKLIDILIHLENNNILSTRLDSEFRNDFFDNIYEELINNLDFSNENYASFSQSAKIDLILGISYPFIIPILKEINNYLNLSLIENYLENEDDYRFDDSKEINNYFNEKNTLENNLTKEFEKKYFSKIFNGNELNLDKQKFGEILFKDYIIYYLSKSNYRFSNKKILDFFKSLFQLFIRREEKGYQNLEEEQKEDIYISFSIENISKFVLYIESYKTYLYPLCEFICSIDLNVNNFIEDFILKVSLNQFKIKNINLSIINGIFFNIFESATYCIHNINKDFKDFSDDDFEKFLNNIKLFSNILVKANIELRLTLKQLLYLLDFIQVKEIFGKNGIQLKENMQTYLKYLQKENEFYLIPDYLNSKKENYNEDIINDEFTFLKNKLNILKEYPELIAKLLNNKMKISKDEEYRLKLLNISFSNNLFIIKNKNIFEIILKRFKLCPINKNKDKEKNIEEDEEEEEYDGDETGEIFLSQLEEEQDNLIIKFLNKTNNLCLDEILLSLFDGKFTLFFENKKKADLILNQSFDIFKKCVNYIENKKYKISNNNKLGFLYCISYIKYYSYNFAKIVFRSFLLQEVFSS